jgi:hypothetical protein
MRRRDQLPIQPGRRRPKNRQIRRCNHTPGNRAQPGRKGPRSREMRRPTPRPATPREPGQHMPRSAVTTEPASPASGRYIASPPLGPFTLSHATCKYRSMFSTGTRAHVPSSVFLRCKAELAAERLFTAYCGRSRDGLTMSACPLWAS